jgi:hypothetical protein
MLTAILILLLFFYIGLQNHSLLNFHLTETKNETFQKLNRTEFVKKQDLFLTNIIYKSVFLRGNILLGEGYFLDYVMEFVSDGNKIFSGIDNPNKSIYISLCTKSRINWLTKQR